MRKNFFLSFALIAVALLTGMQSCKDKTVVLVQEFSNLDFCVAASESKWLVRDFDVNKSDWETFLSDNGITFDAGKIDEVRFESFKIDVVSPAGLNFNEYDYAEVYLKKDNETGDGTKIGYISSIGTGAVSIDFINQGEELKSFFNENHFVARVRIFRNDPSSAQHCFKANLKLKLEVKK